MTKDTNTASGAADLLDLIEAYAEARHRQGHSSYNAQTAAALQAVKDELAAGQATAAQAVVQDDLITLRKPTTSAEMLWLLKLAHLVISDMDKTLEKTLAPAQPAVEQGAAYAELEKKHADFVETVGLMLAAIGYKEDYARQWPKEKASVTFRRWFDEQRASHGQAPAWAADSFSEYGAVTTHSVTGQKFFYAAGAPPYLDNASECVTVYAKQKQPRPDDQGTPKDGWTDSSPTSCARGLGADQHHEHRARQSDRDGAHSECNSGCHGIHGPCDISQEVATPTAKAAESVPAPVPPPECDTAAEKRAFAFGWFRALESERMKADSVQEDAAREAIEKVLALFPFNALIQKFSVNNGPCLTADNDDEFYSVKRVLAFLTEIKTTLDAARKQGGV